LAYVKENGKGGMAFLAFSSTCVTSFAFSLTYRFAFAYVKENAKEKGG